MKDSFYWTERHNSTEQFYNLLLISHYIFGFQEYQDQGLGIGDHKQVYVN